MKLILLLGIILLSSCENYMRICDATSVKGWHMYDEPTQEMRSIFNAEESKYGKIKWFKNRDGRIRVCDAYPKYDCAAYYKTHNPANAKNDEVLVSSCPSPY